MVDVSEGAFVDWVLLTPGMTQTDGPQIQPTWCGSDHIVWVRQGTAVPYDPEICVLEVDEDGPIGDPSCYWGGDELDDGHPSCNAAGTMLAWARQEAGYGSDQAMPFRGESHGVQRAGKRGDGPSGDRRRPLKA